jgi:translation initiation factor 3 subunit L
MRNSLFDSPDALSAFEELFLYACPKFVSANGPPYEDAGAIDRFVAASADPDAGHPHSQTDCTRRHLDLFLSDVAAHQPVPTLRSFLKLYTSLGTRKLSNFLDADEEELVQEMMVLKQASRSVSRVAGGEGVGLLEGQTITTSDLNFNIDEVTISLGE